MLKKKGLIITLLITLCLILSACVETKVADISLQDNMSANDGMIKTMTAKDIENEVTLTVDEAAEANILSVPQQGKKLQYIHLDKVKLLNSVSGEEIDGEAGYFPAGRFFVKVNENGECEFFPYYKNGGRAVLSVDVYGGGVSASAKISEITYENVSEAVGKLANKVNKKKNTPIRFEMKSDAFSSRREMLEYLGLKVDRNAIVEEGKTYCVVSIKKCYFSVLVNNQNANEFFSSEMTTSMLETAMGDKIPSYISKVEYGQLAYIVYETNKMDKNKLQSLISTGVNLSEEGIVENVSSFATLLAENEISISKIKIYGGSAGELDISKPIVDILNDLNKIESEKAGMPISYSFSYMSDCTPMKISKNVDVVIPEYHTILPTSITYSGVDNIVLKRNSSYKIKPNELMTKPADTLFTKYAFKLVSPLDGVKIDESGIVTVGDKVKLGSKFNVEITPFYKFISKSDEERLPSCYVNFTVNEDLSTQSATSFEELDNLLNSQDIEYAENIIVNLKEEGEVARTIAIPNSVSKFAINGNGKTIAIKLDVKNRTAPLTLEFEDIKIFNYNGNPIILGGEAPLIIVVKKEVVFEEEDNSQLVMDALVLTSDIAFNLIGNMTIECNYSTDGAIKKLNENAQMVKSGNGKLRVVGVNDFYPPVESVTLTCLGETTELKLNEAVRFKVDILPKNVVVETMTFNLPDQVDSYFVKFDNKNLVVYLKKALGKRDIEIQVVVNKVSSNTVTIQMANEMYISNAEDFDDLYKGDNRKGKVFLLQNIDISNSKHMNFGEFEGYFDGNGRTISGVKLHIPPSEYDFESIGLGLFSEIAENAVVENLKIKCDISSETYHGNGNYTLVGGLAGICYGTVRNVTVDGTMFVHRQYSCAGGIIGEMRGNAFLENCVNNVYVFSNRRSGGIVGYMKDSSIVSKCVNNGSILIHGVDKRYKSAGGISACCIDDTKIFDCVNNGEIKAMTKSTCIAGIAAELQNTAKADSSNKNYGKINSNNQRYTSSGEITP